LFALSAGDSDGCSLPTRILEVCESADRVAIRCTGRYLNAEEAQLQPDVVENPIVDDVPAQVSSPCRSKANA
jgi:L-asparaginase II